MKKARYRAYHPGIQKLILKGHPEWLRKTKKTTQKNIKLTALMIAVILIWVGTIILLWVNY